MREISASELGQHRLFLASPQFGGQCSTIFARSLADLAIRFILSIRRINSIATYIWKALQ